MLDLKDISLRSSFILFFGFQFVLIATVVILIAFIFQVQTSLTNSQNAQSVSNELADELRHSSDDLTRFARAYVETGDPKFENAYWTVLNIRNGVVPRPEEYHRIYWDFVLAPGGEKPSLDGQTVALKTLMVRAGFTREEFDRLALAQRRSDELVTIEERAMSARKGLFDDGTGSYTVKKAPDIRLANELLNNDEYYRIKAEIMRPIEDFHELLSERMSGSIDGYYRNLSTLYRALQFALVLLFLAFIVSFWIVFLQIVKRERFERDLKILSEDLEERIKERTDQLRKSEESAKKALEDAERLNMLMVDRELEMIKLKRRLAEETK